MSVDLKEARACTDRAAARRARGVLDRPPHRGARRKRRHSPGAGVQSRRRAHRSPKSRSLTAREVDRAVAAANGRLARLARHAAARSARACCSSSRSCSTTHHGDARGVRSRASTARCSPTRSGEDRARHRGRRVRVRDPAAAQGRAQRQRRRRHRQLVAAPAARRVRRHHAVQLPGDGAALDVPGRGRVRQHVRAQAERARPERVARCSPSWSSAQARRPACSTSCRATRRRSTRCSSTRTWRP